jgi:hypothetical protein
VSHLSHAFPQLRHVGSLVRHRPGITTAELGDLLDVDPDLTLSEWLYRCGRHYGIAQDTSGHWYHYTNAPSGVADGILRGRPAHDFP